MNFKHQNRFWITIVGLVTLGLTFFPFLEIGYTTADDVDGLTVAISLSEILSHVGTSGRLSHYLISIVGHLRTLIDSFVYLKFFYILPILGCIAISTYLIQLMFKSFSVALIFFSLIIVSQQNSWQHNIISAFPFTIQLGFCTFLGSLAWFLLYLRTRRISYHLLSLIAFVFSLLMYEMFLPFIVAHLIMALCYHSQSISDSRLPAKKFKRLAHDSAWHIAAFATILLSYIYLRMTADNSYRGTSLATNFSFTNYFRSVWEFSVSYIPPRYFFDHVYVYAALRESFEPFEMNLGYILLQCQPEWLSRAGLLFGLTLWALQGSYKFKVSLLDLICGATGGIIMIFLPNVLIAIGTDKQEMVANGYRTYTGSYISVYPFMFLFTGLICIAREFFRKWSVTADAYFAALIAILVSFLSFSSDFLNYHVGTSQKKDFAMWGIMSEFVATDQFRKIQQGSIVYAPSLWRAGRFWGLFHPSPAMDDYWSKFVRLKTGVSINFVRNMNPAACDLINSSKAPSYYLRYIPDSKDERYTLTLAVLSSAGHDCSEESMETNTVDVFSLSRYDQISIFGILGSGTGDGVISSGRDQGISSNANFFGLTIDQFTRSPSGKLAHFQLKSENRPVLASSIRIAHGGEPLPVIFRKAQ